MASAFFHFQPILNGLLNNYLKLYRHFRQKKLLSKSPALLGLSPPATREASNIQSLLY